MRIVQIKKSVFELLRGNSQEVPTEDDIKAFEKMKSSGFLLSNYPDVIVHPSDDILEDALVDDIQMMILQVTQQCNFRCSYCPYTIGTEDRTHSNKKMTLEMAKKGVDFLLTHSANVKAPVIGFYGGEPLLEFELIKELMEYATEKADGKIIGFNMTTNGSLLTEEKVDYFHKYPIKIMISLDGPQSVHDSNRKLAGTGIGSFDKIVANIKALRNKYPDFVKNQIQYNAVIDPVNDFGCFNDFFVSADYITDANMLRTEVLQREFTDYDSEEAHAFFLKREQETFKLFLSQLNRFDKDKVSPIVSNRFSDLINKIHLARKSTNSLPEKAHPSGPCVPGTIRVFMNTDGDLLPCEKVNENSSVFKIGHVDSGFDYPAIRKLLNIGKLTEENCKKCWAFTLCISCAKGCEEGNELSKDKKLRMCNEIRWFIDDIMKNYCTLKELGYDYHLYGFSDYMEIN
jgi:uncharacterized protein